MLRGDSQPYSIPRLTMKPRSHYCTGFVHMFYWLRSYAGLNSANAFEQVKLTLDHAMNR